MPDWAGDKQKRLAKIQQAMAALEADAKLAAEEERRIAAEKEQQRQAEGRKKPGKPAAPPSDQPDPKSQRNFTDPESRIMKSKDGFVQAYNAQAAVDAGAQIWASPTSIQLHCSRICFCWRCPRATRARRARGLPRRISIKAD